MTLVQAFVFLVSLSSCFAAKFAMFPMPFGRSHFIFVAKLGQELAERGHEVKIYTGSSQRYAESNPYVRFFNDSKSTALLENSPPPDPKSMKELSSVASLAILFTVQSYHCDEMLSDTELMNEVSRADVVVGEFIYPCSSLVADKWSLPYVIISAFSLAQPLAMSFGLPLAPSYVPQFGMHLSDEWSLLDRARNALQWIFGYATYALYLCPVHAKIKEKYNITPEKSIHETLGRVDLIIGQMPFGLEHPRPIYPNTRVVGPLLPSPAKPLPDELEQFMQNAGEKGVILVSFGTVVGEKTRMDEESLKMMAEAFSKLQEKVIWKLKLNGKSKPPTVSANVKLLPWIPQNDILGHPKTRLFIAHAGINGILESTYHGVPMICSPFFGDQFDNAHMAKQAGFAEAMDLDTTSSEELASLIRKMLNQPSYRESAARISKYVKLLPRPPVKEAADWVEYTHAQGGLQHLRPRGLDLSFYQLYFLDILLLAFLTFFVIFFVIKMLLTFVISKLSGSSKKEKKN